MKYSLYIHLLLVFVLLSTFVSADIGPKPTVDIDVSYEGEDLGNQFFYAKMFECYYRIGYEDIAEDLAPYYEVLQYTPQKFKEKCVELVTDRDGNVSLCDYKFFYQQRILNLSKYASCEFNQDKYRPENCSQILFYNEIEGREYEPSVIYACTHSIWDICENFPSKIPDLEKGCYWTVDNNAWGGTCTNSTCHFGYSPPSTFKLAVFVPNLNKIFISNEISRKSFYSNYDVDLFSDGSAKIQQTDYFFTWTSVVLFLRALILTVILELIVASIFLLATKTKKRALKKLILTVLLANIVSLPFVWFIFPLIKISGLVIPLAELFVFAFEAFFIYLLNKRKISLKKSVVLSLIMNLTSFFVGGVIYLLLNYSISAGSIF